MKHYIKVWRLIFDVYKSHVERGELLIKVSLKKSEIHKKS